MLNANVKYTTMRGLVDNSTVGLQNKIPEGEIHGRLTELEGYLQELHDAINEAAFRLVAVLTPADPGNCAEGSTPKAILSPLADRLETILQSARMARESLRNIANRINI